MATYANYDSESPPEAGAALYNNNHHFDPGMAGPGGRSSYYPGVASMMCAIDPVRGKYPFDGRARMSVVLYFQLPEFLFK